MSTAETVPAFLFAWDAREVTLTGWDRQFAWWASQYPRSVAGEGSGYRTFRIEFSGSDSRPRAVVCRYRLDEDGNRGGDVIPQAVILGELPPLGLR